MRDERVRETVTREPPASDRRRRLFLLGLVLRKSPHAYLRHGGGNMGWESNEAKLNVKKKLEGSGSAISQQISVY